MTKKDKLTIYCDMDGVLADFFGVINAVERFEHEQDFFYKLKPIQNNVDYIYDLITKGKDVYILSASPNARADQDKIKWLNKYMPYIKREKIIIMRNGQNKADFIKTTGINLLFDDYGKNCEQWTQSGLTNLAIQVKGAILKK